MSDSPAHNDATDTPNTVEHFGRTWGLPSAVHYADQKRLNAILASQMVRSIDIAFAETFLSDEDQAALAAINPTMDELDEFGTKIGTALGFQGSGNS